MITVVLLGSGNVAYHLALALQSTPEVELIQRYGRSDNNHEFFETRVPLTNDLNRLEKADIYIIAISDEAIRDLSKKLDHVQGLVVHTSGSIGMDQINTNLKHGVLYPVQSFTIEQELDFKKVPLAIEAGSKADFNLLEKFANLLSDNVYNLSSLDRERLHLSAVFANNFSNYMFTCANAICQEYELPFDILRPIILESAKKIQRTEPLIAQTGPARRNDKIIIDQHLNLLEGEKKEIYSLLSKAIIKTYRKEQ